MSYLKLNKAELINLEYSLSREIIRSNRAGSYASTTLIGCNTRKYHGLLICPMEHLDGNKHVLLSALDCTIVQDSREFNLGIHKYQGDNYHPKGHKYIQDYDAEPIPKIYYRVGGVRLLREALLVAQEQQILIRYTLLEADKTTSLRFTPYLAFRNVHQLSRSNLHANTKIRKIQNGIKSRLYDGYPYLHMQFSKENEFVQVPDWYYNIEYSEEQKRGYEFQEDLLVPGFFELSVRKGESIVFSASTKEANSEGLKRKFANDIKKRIPRDTFKNCLLNSAEQFFVNKDKKTDVIAGFPWFGSFGRNTFMALPGLTLPQNDSKTFLAVVNTMVKKLKYGVFPHMGTEDEPLYNTVDASLWFFWALQQYAIHTSKEKEIWKSYGKYMKSILKSYRQGTIHNIHMLENGLIYSGELGQALTWMDAIVEGKPVTSRIGCNVEINALWYNAICFSLNLAEKTNDKAFISEWGSVPEQVADSFVQGFWDADKAYLADTINGTEKDWTVRPNQVIAVAMPYSPINERIKKAVLYLVQQVLLTPRGLRSLAPSAANYKGVYEGNQEDRDRAYHQGTAWPWLLEHFAEGYLQIYKKAGLPLIKKLISDFEPAISGHGVGAISEIYDGDPPHLPKGAISHAGSVAALLRIIDKIEKIEDE